MPTQVINANGTFQLKTGSGYINRCMVISPGSAWTVQFKDGPVGPTNSTNPILGSTAFTLIAVGNPFAADQLIFFPNGIQVVTAGTTPGELDIDWY